MEHVWVVTETEWCGGYREGSDSLLKAFDSWKKASDYKEGLEKKREEAKKNYYNYNYIFDLNWSHGNPEEIEDLIKEIKNAGEDVDEGKLRRTLELLRNGDDEEILLLENKSWNIERLDYDRS
jgi:hypothetical protein